MRRRSFMAAAAVATVAFPAIVRAEPHASLRFVPAADTAAGD